MSKRSARGKDPKPNQGPARPGFRAGARSGGRGVTVAPAQPLLPGSEISAKLQHLAEDIDALPADLIDKIPSASAGSQEAGVEVTDHGLLGRSGRPTAAQVIAIDAQPDPGSPGGLIIRLDGWQGSLVMTLTRDRAELLASRLGSAITRVRDWYGVPPSPRPPGH